MANRPPKKAPAKRRKPADDVARTPEYQALLKGLVDLIEAAKKRGVLRPRVTMRDLRKKAMGKEVGDGE